MRQQCCCEAHRASSEYAAAEPAQRANCSAVKRTMREKYRMLVYALAQPPMPPRARIAPGHRSLWRLCFLQHGHIKENPGLIAAGLVIARGVVVGGGNVRGMRSHAPSPLACGVEPRIYSRAIVSAIASIWTTPTMEGPLE